MSNVSPKLHVHFVPRYKEPSEFSGTVFIDQRWGKNYAPYDRSFIIEDSLLYKIRDAIKEHL